MSMTWNEFKNQMDSDLKKEGKTGDEEIWYIDITYPHADEIVIGIDEGDGITVS